MARILRCVPHNRELFHDKRALQILPAPEMACLYAILLLFRLDFSPITTGIGNLHLLIFRHLSQCLDNPTPFVVSYSESNPFFHPASTAEGFLKCHFATQKHRSDKRFARYQILIDTPVVPEYLHSAGVLFGWFCKYRIGSSFCSTPIVSGSIVLFCQLQYLLYRTHIIYKQLGFFCFCQGI